MKCSLLILISLINIPLVVPNQTSPPLGIVQYQFKVEKWLNEINYDLSKFNSLAAHLSWKLSTNSDQNGELKAMQLSRARNRWKNKICAVRIKNHLLTVEQKRKLYLLCRGPKFTDDMAIKYLKVLGNLAQEYNSEICLTPPLNPLTLWNTTDFPKPGNCVYGEPYLEEQMRRTDLSPDQLKWLWVNWHNSIGPKIKRPFLALVALQNIAARNNGYRDISEVWQEELEIPYLETFVETLYQQIEPLYILLHAVVRDKLYKKYGPKEIDPSGPIPAHLLGNMWAQDWSSLFELFHLSNERIDLERNLRLKNITVKDMVLEAEDFYTSLNLPRMTNKFWKYSFFEENSNLSVCHGSAANLYEKGDYRIMMCGKITMNDFYVIHHEMGHIEYYMAYEQQPAIFQDGVNTAFHESIGDAIMHGVMTPQHLHRIKLINDRELISENLDLILILKQALQKVPEIPFSLIVDKYRWKIFKGQISPNELNQYYWKLNEKYRGVAPPEERTEAQFDAGAKFHIPDNTPYIRYFLGSIIQMQIFESLCEISLYGKLIDKSAEEKALPLHRCDIYGSKNGGKKLRKMMEKGSSIHWSEAMQMFTGKNKISVDSLLRYYEPVYKFLKHYVELNNVRIGW